MMRNKAIVISKQFSGKTNEQILFKFNDIFYNFKTLNRMKPHKILQQQSSSSKSTLKNQINAILPFAERKCTNNVHQMQGTTSAKSFKLVNKMNGGNLSKHYKSSSVGFVPPEQRTILSPKQSKQQTQMGQGIKNPFKNASMEENGNTLESSLHNKNLSIKASILGEKALNAYQKSFANSSTVTKDLSSVNHPHQLQTTKNQMQENQKRHMKNTAQQTCAFGLDECRDSGGFFSSAQNLDEAEKIVHKDRRNSCSPSYSQNEAVRETLIYRGSVCTLEEVNMAQPAQTDPIDAKKQANAQLKHRWQQVKPTELKVSKVLRKQSTSNSSRQQVLSSGGASCSHKTQQQIHQIPFKKGATQTQLLKKDQIQLVTTAQFTGKNKPQITKITRKSKKSNRINMALINKDASKDQYNTVKVLKSETNNPLEGNARPQQDDSSPDHHMRLNTKANENLDGLPQVEIEQVDSSGKKSKMIKKLLRPLSINLTDNQDPKTENVNVGRWLTQEIKCRLKAKKLGHVIEDPNHESVPKSGLASMRATSTRRFEFKESLIGNKNNQTKTGGVQSPAAISKILSPKNMVSKNFKSLRDVAYQQQHQKQQPTDKNDYHTMSKTLTAKNEFRAASRGRDPKNNIFESPPNKQQPRETSPVQSQHQCPPIYNSGEAQQSLEQYVPQPKYEKQGRSSLQAVKTSSQQKKPIEEDDFIVREQRVKEKLKMIHESDQKKVFSQLQESINRSKVCPKQLSTQLSTLQPFQNYTSTNDELYSETIEKRKIREAIGKFSTTMKHPPISTVEKKKQQRMFTQIERKLTKKVDSSNGNNFLPGGQQQTGANENQLTESSPIMSTKSPSPFGNKKMSATKLQFSKEQVDADFFLTGSIQLPVYEETSEECLTQTNQKTKQLQIQKPSELATRKQSSRALDRIQSPGSSDGGENKFMHKTLSVMMRKAAKFDVEANLKFNEQRHHEASEKEGLVKMARNFTNKSDFQKTFLRKSDALSSPLRNKFKHTGTTVNDKTKRDELEDSLATDKVMLTSPSPQSKVHQKEDRSFFMRMQRQYSQRQLMMTASKFNKEPQLLYANQPQILRRPSPARKDIDGPSSRRGISPHKIQDSLTTGVNSHNQNQIQQKRGNMFASTTSAQKAVLSKTISRLAATKKNLESLNQAQSQHQTCNTQFRQCSPLPLLKESTSHFGFDPICEEDGIKNELRQVSQQVVLGGGKFNGGGSHKLLIPRSRQSVNTAGYLYRTHSGNN